MRGQTVLHLGRITEQPGRMSCLFLVAVEVDGHILRMGQVRKQVLEHPIHLFVEIARSVDGCQTL